MLGYADLAGDARAAGGMLGKGLVNLAGFESKEDAIKRIWENTDWEDEEQTDKALAEIRRIDPNVWSQAVKMQEQELAYRTKVNLPQLETEWRLKGKELHTSQFSQTYLPGQPDNIKNKADMVKYLIGLVREEKIANTEKNDYLKTYDAFIKETEKAFYKSNRNRDFNKSENNISSASIIDPSIKTEAEKVLPNANTNEYLQQQYPDASVGGLQWRSNFNERDIGNLGTQVSPNPNMPYTQTDTANTFLSIPGVDATIGSLNDLVTKGLNGIIGYIGDGINLMTGTVEGDKIRAIAEKAKDWYDDGRGHKYFREHPEKLDEAKKDPLGFYKSLNKTDR